MKKLSDNHIQQMLDKGLPTEEEEITVDDKAELEKYQSLFSLLDEDQPDGLSYGFATKVTRKIQAGINRSIGFKGNLLALLIAIAGLALSFVLLSSYHPAAGNQFFRVITSHKWILIFLTMVTLFAQYPAGKADKVKG